MWILEMTLFAYLVTLSMDLKGFIRKFKNDFEIKVNCNFKLTVRLTIQKEG